MSSATISAWAWSNRPATVLIHLRRLLGLGLVWLAVTGAAFALFRLAPGDPAAIFAQTANTGGADVMAAIERQWGLDRPIGAQFLGWLAALARGDLGLSFADRQSVLADFAERLPWSAAIGAGGLSLAILIAWPLAFAAALRPGGAADFTSRGFAIAGQALPAFVVGLVMLWLLAAKLQWIRPLSGGPVERILLPVILVAVFSIGGFSRVLRATFAEVLTAPWFRTALAKGLSRRGALWAHGNGHALLVLLAVVTPELAWVIGGTAVAEIVFGTPGLSERLVQAVAARDYPVLQAYVALIAAIMLVARGAARGLRTRLDPRPAA